MSVFERIYYQLNMTLVSPMSVGSGESEDTDHDVFVDSRGLPVIPATTIAGVLRAYIGEDTAESLFGKIAQKEGEEAIESQIRIYDAECIQGGSSYISNRDFVKLKDKVGVKGAKFDSQIVETGAEFVSYIELLHGGRQSVLESALAALDSGIIGFGAKTTRGFGRVKLVLKKRIFNDVDAWLDFKMFDNREWENEKAIVLENTALDKAVISVSLKLQGGISIREYSTEVNMPDYKTLSLKSCTEYTPVIPGSSWAGAFRDRCAKILTAEEITIIFGDVKEKTAVKSKIAFSESIIKGGTAKDITRNSIDRFSAATKSGALYTERTYFYGNTKLDITVPLEDKAVSAIGVCLADLHNGFLSVGGLTSIGRGLFSISKISANGKNLTGYITGDSVDIKAFAAEVMRNE